FLFNTIMSLERVLFENAMINSFVEEADTYYRDPWTLPEVDPTGQITRNEFGVPLATDASEVVLNEETGQVMLPDATRTYEEGLIRSLTSRRQTLAFFSTLVTGVFAPGQMGFGTQGSFMRSDMVPDTIKINRTELTQEEAETLIMSVWDP